jgi:MFS family permease
VQSRSVPQALSPRTARNALAVLTFVNLFNYIDRFVVAGLTETLKKSELHLSDGQIGLLATAFLAVYALVSPRFGTLGDTRSRPRVIAFGVAVWSLATAFGGFATGFISLFLARAFVGVGEAAYGTIAPSVLADAFPKRRRGRVFAIFYAAIPIGAAMGYLVASAMGDHWRAAFFVAGVPGLVLATVLLRLPDPPRGAQDDVLDAHAPPPRDAWRHYRRLLGNRQFAFTVFGYAGYTFGLGGLSWWMVSFLERVHGTPHKTAAFQVGIVAVATGLVGTIVGGWIGDRLLTRTRHAYLLVSGAATVLAAPCAYVALTATDPTVYMTALVAAELLIFASTGPINSAIVNYVAPTERATAMALSILLIHVLGDVPSPYVVGMISDVRKAAALSQIVGTPSIAQVGAAEAAGLQGAVLILPLAILVGGLIWTVGALQRGSPGET